MFNWLKEKWRESEDEAAAVKEFMLILGLGEEVKKALVDNFLKGFWEEYFNVKRRCAQERLVTSVYVEIYMFRFEPLRSDFNKLLEIDKAKTLGAKFGGIISVIESCGYKQDYCILRPEEIELIIKYAISFKKSLKAAGVNLKHDMIAERIHEIASDNEIRGYMPNFWPQMVRHIAAILGSN